MGYDNDFVIAYGHALIAKQLMNERIEFNTVSPEPIKQHFSVTEDFIREAHKAACADWKKKIEAQFPQLSFRTYKVGERLRNRFGNEVIIAHVEYGKVMLINLDNGNRYHEPAVEVSDTHAITEKEFTAMSGGGVFTPINVSPAKSRRGYGILDYMDAINTVNKDGKY